MTRKPAKRHPYKAMFERADHLARRSEVSGARRAVLEHLPEDIPIQTDLDGNELLITDENDVQFLDGRNPAIDGFCKMYCDILSVQSQTGRPSNVDWLDGYRGSFKQAFDRLSVEYKRVTDSTSADWPVARLPNERGNVAADPGGQFTLR